MTTKRDRSIEGVSLSFLDVISCGFGAIILLLVLTRVFDPVLIDENIDNLDEYLSNLESELESLRKETLKLRGTLLREQDRNSEELEALTRIISEQSSVEEAFKIANQEQKTAAAIEQKLAKAQQQMSKELQDLLADYRKTEDDQTIGGIPVDSEYVIFIIDTSAACSITHGLWWYKNYKRRLRSIPTSKAFR